VSRFPNKPTSSPGIASGGAAGHERLARCAGGCRS